MLQPGQKDVISAQFKLALDDVKEEKTFFLLIEADTWPEDVLNFKNTLLCTTLFDEEIMTSRDNYDDEVNSLIRMFRKIYPVFSQSQDSEQQNFSTGGQSLTRSTVEQSWEKNPREVELRQCSQIVELEKKNDEKPVQLLIMQLASCISSPSACRGSAFQRGVQLKVDIYSIWSWLVQADSMGAK